MYKLRDLKGKRRESLIEEKEVRLRNALERGYIEDYRGVRDLLMYYTKLNDHIKRGDEIEREKLRYVLRKMRELGRTSIVEKVEKRRYPTNILEYNNYQRKERERRGRVVDVNKLRYDIVVSIEELLREL